MENTQTPEPGAGLGQILEYIPIVETIVSEVIALHGTAVGETQAIPIIKGVRIAGQEGDLQITWTRRG